MKSVINNIYEPRFYRLGMGKERFKSFTVTHRETDLWVGIDNVHFTADIKKYILEEIIELRKGLEKYIEKNPDFYTALSPYKVKEKAPRIAKIMARAAGRARVGPMAAIAGSFSEEIGKLVEEKFGVSEIIVENGGDIYLKFQHPILMSVFAGSSPLSGKVGIEVCPSLSPLGICTSSGTIGHSLSFGKSDAVTVMCKNTASADAYATALGNKIQCQEDIRKVLDISCAIEDILGIIVIVGNKIGVYGEVKIVPL